MRLLLAPFLQVVGVHSRQGSRCHACGYAKVFRSSCVQMVLKVVVRCRTPGIGYGPRPLIVTTNKIFFFPSRREGKFRPHERFFFFLSDPFNYYSGSEPSLMIFCVALRIVPLKTLSEGFHAICNDDERFVRDHERKRERKKSITPRNWMDSMVVNGRACCDSPLPGFIRTSELVDALAKFVENRAPCSCRLL